MALNKYRFLPESGLYTDMNAIRKDETLDNLHSLYVDQWDWERVILPNDRNVAYLEQIVRKIVKAIVETKELLNERFSGLKETIEEEVFFITSEQLLQKVSPSFGQRKGKRNLPGKRKPSSSSVSATNCRTAAGTICARRTMTIGN